MAEHFGKISNTYTATNSQRSYGEAGNFGMMGSIVTKKKYISSSLLVKSTYKIMGYVSFSQSYRKILASFSSHMLLELLTHCVE